MSILWAAIVAGVIVKSMQAIENRRVSRMFFVLSRTMPRKVEFLKVSGSVVSFWLSIIASIRMCPSVCIGLECFCCLSRLVLRFWSISVWMRCGIASNGMRITPDVSFIVVVGLIHNLVRFCSAINSSMLL